MLRINDEAPNFTAETSQGKIDFHEWIGTGWAFFAKATLVLIGSSAAWGWLATVFQRLSAQYHF